ncbi:efflux RND transporter periplasmic adaptor subunit [Roseateles koreensis]|uniref:Efflux RND transporter periplasmic adaptor subunit n=1 Tax=Roseateles koreensis TaxID=2987526 RepID=A0ABT5KQG0_9BURK|nr:efflux RND transporter periplasmic adaptor subunit [Roseateles koreensis]MDC8785143.1 efflux RND transporter periplasmic adaptor subunit [Roseateles koreensis]
MTRAVSFVLAATSRPVLISLFALSALCNLSACGKGGAEAKAGAAAAASAPEALLIAPEDLRSMTLGAYAQGPVITGSVQPERKADLRAEVSAVVQQVLKENGQHVHRGELLVRLDDTAIRDGLTSANEAARAATQTFEQAERQFQRLKTLHAQGMSSLQALEDAELRRNGAQSDLVAAKARVVSAQQLLTRTEVRAPFDGVVSERKVSIGDTAQVGKELVKVIDPHSMRFEGLVSADRMQELKVGQSVNFRVNGYAKTDFTGTIRRVDVAANATTRQVEVLVDFEPGQGPDVAGLYAEGRVQSTEVKSLMLPEASVVRAGDAAYAWRIKDGVLNKVKVELGERDARQGAVAVRAGLVVGDEVLRNPGSNLKDGQAVKRVASPAGPSSSMASLALSGK